MSGQKLVNDGLVALWRLQSWVLVDQDLWRIRLEELELLYSQDVAAAPRLIDLATQYRELDRQVFNELFRRSLGEAQNDAPLPGELYEATAEFCEARVLAFGTVGLRLVLEAYERLQPGDYQRRNLRSCLVRTGNVEVELLLARLTEAEVRLEHKAVLDPDLSDRFQADEDDIRKYIEEEWAYYRRAQQPRSPKPRGTN